MVKYYVYTTHQEDSEALPSNQYVQEEYTEVFAEQGFDPLTMKFTGIMVEASNPNSARDIYCRPSEYEGDGELYMVNEPEATVRKRAQKMQEIQDVFEEQPKIDVDALIEQANDPMFNPPEPDSMFDEIFKAQMVAITTGISEDLLDVNVLISNMARLASKHKSNTKNISPRLMHATILALYVETLARSKYESL